MPNSHNTLPVVLIAAAVQGWALYALHLSIAGSHWPATQPGWLLALYAVATFVPLTVQLLADYARRGWMWLIVLSMAMLFAYFGWHHGARVVSWDTDNFVSSGRWFPLVFVLGVLWLHMLPFIQCRLAGGGWRAPYAALFDAAWRNTLMIAEAVLFTTLFWLLLFLWQALFAMLGIRFFSELFREPIFIYPVSALAFGFALHLIGSIERLTGVILEQLLNVLKWLLLIAGLILALFTVALIFKLPGMVASGERAISAAWLLWLIAVTVLFVNAAYRDGSVERPYPRWISLALRGVVPLIVVIAITALYALFVRIGTYGFTVERVWAVIVAIAAFIYAIGYAFAASRGGRWMGGIAKVNVVTALFMISAVSLALTPVLSPYRIAADSQFRRTLAMPQAAASSRPATPSVPGGKPAAALDAPGRASDRSADGSSDRSRSRAPGGTLDEDALAGPGYAQDTPLRYLRFGAGRYGTARLQELASLQDHPRATQIREAAAAMLARQQRWQPAVPTNLQQRLEEMAVHPSGRSLDAALLERLEADLKDPQWPWRHSNPDRAFGGVFVDLNADGNEEFVLVAGASGAVYERRQGVWRRVASMTPARGFGAVDDSVVAEIGKGNVAVQEPVWRELAIGGQRFRLNVEVVD